MTKLYLDGQEVDLSKDTVLIPVTYCVDDISDISKNSSDYTKTIKIPGTQRNNQLFNFLFDIKAVQTEIDTGNNIGGNYNFKKKTRADVWYNNQIILFGYARLVSAVTTNGVVEYEIQIVSELSAFASTLSDKKLEDISRDLVTQYDQVLGRHRVIDSWTEQDENPSTGVLYPMIDYGIAETVNAVNWELQCFRPALFLKQYIDLIFADAGYTYTSDFLDSDYFKRMVFPFVDEAMKSVGNVAKVATCLQFTDLGLDHGAYYDTPSVGEHYPFACVVEDNPETPSYSGTAFTAPLSSYYDVELNFPDMSFYFTNVNLAFSLGNTKQRFWVVYERYAPDYSSGEVVASWYKTFDDLEIFKTATFTHNGTEWEYTAPDTFTIAPSTQRVFLQEGEHLKVSCYLSSKNDMIHQLHGGYPGSSLKGTTTIKSNVANPPTLTIGKSKLFDGALVTYADFVPKGIKQIDFIASVFKLFNLFPVADKDRPKHFNIYQRDDFYQTGKLIDWTDKVDYSQPITVVPIPTLDSATLNFSYKEDKDYYNALYKAECGGKIYGEYTRDTGYEFNRNTKKVLEKTIFSPTIPVQYASEPFPCESTFEVMTSAKQTLCVTGYNELEGDELPSNGAFTKAKIGAKILYNGTVYRIVNVYNPYSFEVDDHLPGTDNGGYWIKNATFTYLTSNDKIIPAIYQSNDGNLTRKPLKVNPRVLYYSGLKECNQYFIQDTPILMGKEYVYTSNPYYTTQIKYPVLSHLDDNLHPTKDLLFSKPEQVYFNAENYPDYYNEQTGLYTAGFENLYKGWRNSVGEIVDNEAKLVKCKVRLSSIDIANLNMADTININGTYFRLNKVIDFIPDSNLLTQVELVRIPKLEYDPAPLPPPAPSCRQYRAYNNSTLSPQNIQYYDCDGQLSYENISPQQYRDFCALEGTVSYNPYITLEDWGECGSVPGCKSYEVTNKVGFAITTGYKDCNNVDQVLNLNGSETKTLCALEGTIQNGFDYLTITDKGECLPECIQYSVKNTADDFGVFVYFRNCDNQPTSVHLEPDQMRLVCALEGSISVSPDVTVTKTGFPCGAPPDPGEEEATVEVENNSAWSGKNITGVEVNGVGVDGISFPVTTGNSGTGTTDQVGTYTIDVAVIGKTDRSVTVIDSSDTETCLDCVSNSAETLSFSGQTIVDGTTVTVKYNNANCASDCKQYSVQNKTAFGIDVYYTNCAGEETSTHLNASQTKFVCAKEGSISPSPDITVSETGFPC